MTAPATYDAPSFKPGDTVYYLPPLWRTDDHFAGIPAVVLETKHGELYDVALFPVRDTPEYRAGQTEIATPHRLIPREDA